MERSRRARRALASAALAALAGCAVGPDYAEPEEAVPDLWRMDLTRGLAQGQASFQQWWTALDDAVLTSLVQRAGTGMLVNVRLNNAVTAPFLLDTGASDVLIPQSVADRLGLQIGPDTRTKRYSTANGMVEHSVVMLRSVSLGKASVENVPASVSPSMDVGLLGLSFFNHFTYNIDAAAGVVTLTRNRLAESGKIRGGRSQAQWRSEYNNLRWRIAQVEGEYARKAMSKTRERRRLEEERADLERQLELLEAEADQAHVPMVWRQ